MAAPLRPGSMPSSASINGSSPPIRNRRRSMSGATTRTRSPPPRSRRGPPRSRSRAVGGSPGIFRFRAAAIMRNGRSSVCFLGNSVTHARSPICSCHCPRSRSSTTGRYWGSPHRQQVARLAGCVRAEAPLGHGRRSLCRHAAGRTGESGLPRCAGAARLSRVVFIAAGRDRDRPPCARHRVPRSRDPGVTRRDTHGSFRGRADDDRRSRRRDRHGNPHAAPRPPRDDRGCRYRSSHRRGGGVAGAARHGLCAASGRLGIGAALRIVWCALGLRHRPAAGNPPRRHDDPDAPCREPCGRLRALRVDAAEPRPRVNRREERMHMDFEPSDKVKRLQAKVCDFMQREVYPAERVFEEQLNAQPSRWQIPPIMEELKRKARAEGLWNLFLPESEYGAGLTNLEYAPLCEIMGRSPIAPEAFNCSAPDTGNMETLVRYATKEQQERWLKPLLDGDIRSSFAMTEPAVASSDATNIEASIRREGNASYVINARKWWTSGAMDPRCKIFILMGKTDPDAPRHQQQSMILVPRDTPGIRIVRALTVFGYDDAPHGHAEVEFKDVRVPAENILLGEGRGFEIAQGRLGPGRIHHCMRMIGLAERSLEAMVARVKNRVAFGRPLADQGVIREWIADSRMEIEQARLLTLKAAHMMDTVGNKAAQAEIAMVKVVVPKMLLAVIDRAIQAHGGGGVSQEFGLAYAWARSRVMRIVDGPDEVHRRAIARVELRK